MEIYSTVFIRPINMLSGEAKERPLLREIRGFTYAIGHNLPDLPGPVIATEAETNLGQSCLAPTGRFKMTSFEWAVPAVAKGIYQPSGEDYPVTRADIAEFASKAYLAFYAGGEKPFAEIVPASKPIAFDNKHYTQVVSDMNELPVIIGRIEKMWTSLMWNHGVVANVSGVLPLRLILRGNAVKEK